MYFYTFYRLSLPETPQQGPGKGDSYLSVDLWIGKAGTYTQLAGNLERQ